MRYLTCCYLLLICLVCTTAPVQAQPAAPSLIPMPAYWQPAEGSFVVDAQTTIRYKAELRELEPAVRWFTDAVRGATGITLTSNGRMPKGINIVYDAGGRYADEAYELSVTPGSVQISAGSYGGVFYALQTLLQTLPPVRTNATPVIPCMTVRDQPRFSWRGMHLDESRHFFGPETVKSYIDLLARYKFNTFHWHLVDDQGWRIDIARYPELTRTGAWRVNYNHLLWGERPQAKPGEPATYGGYYTADQVRDIVAYARQRNINVVPEIEMPGHVASAIAAYPHLSCRQQPQLPLTGGNYHNISSNYCAGNDSVFQFLEDVLDEILQLFPSKYIHIGGDEVDKGPWKACPRCQQRMRNEGLHNEEELQSYFIRRIEKYLTAKGRNLVGWDEILEGGLAPNATVMSWRGEAGGIEAARMNHDVVMTPGYPLYFDHYQAGPAGEPPAFGGMNTLKNVYDYEPIPRELPNDKHRFVLGAQANVWTEYITTPRQLQYMVLPRMLALSEVLWLPASNKNWNDFNRRLQTHLQAFDLQGLHYCPGDFMVRITPEIQGNRVSAVLSSEIPDARIVYTTDDTEPGLQSPVYTSAVAIDRTMTLRAAVVKDGRIRSPQSARQAFARHAALGRPVSYTHPFSRHYPADGPHSLTDGIRGTYSIRERWHGFSGQDLIATIDLGSVQPIRQLTLGCLQKYADWIFLPQWVRFEISDDGKTYREAGRVANPVSIAQTEAIHNFRFDLPAHTRARFVRVTAANNVCPPGHPGAGKPGWIFADEIEVY